MVKSEASQAGQGLPVTGHVALDRPRTSLGHGLWTQAIPGQQESALRPPPPPPSPAPCWAKVPTGVGATDRYGIVDPCVSSTERSEIWSNIILGFFCRVLEEINIETDRQRETDRSSECGWASSNQLKG